MRSSLGDGWFIELPGEWREDHSEGSVVAWRTPGRSVRASAGDDYRCGTTLDILADIERELPPNPTGKISEGGSNGIGIRAAWFYRDPGGGLRFTLWGYTFTGIDSTRYLVTEFHGEGADWAFPAWRSIVHEP